MNLISCFVFFIQIYLIENRVLQTQNVVTEKFVKEPFHANQIPGFMPPSWWPMLPIEINVPDTIMSMMQGLGNIWSMMSDYFSSANTFVPRNLDLM